MGAFSGNSVFQSGEGNKPKGDQSPDPIAGSGVGTGIMLGLAALVLKGKGQYIETSMMTSNVYCNSDDAFDYSGKPPRRVPDHHQLGLEATYRLYRASEGWVFLAAQFDGEFEQLCAALGREDLARDERFARWPDRLRNKEALSAELEPVFYTRTADDWEALLQAQDVACVRADKVSHVRFLHEDPQLREMGFMVQTQSREFLGQAPGGKYWRHAPVVKFSATPCEAGKSYDGQGVHTRQILEGLGYDEQAIERLAREKVVGFAAWETETA
jgi:crotonobetainyl-CoA:carnitine CoA-transferase CaiB-like acyl-CoA transferase